MASAMSTLVAGDKDTYDNASRSTPDEGRSVSRPIRQMAEEALRDLDLIPFHEFLDGDSRPTFILDMDPDIDVAPNRKVLSPVFCNTSLRHFEILRQVVIGETSIEDLGIPDTGSYEDFRKWALSVTPHDESRDSWPTTFLFAGMLWTGSTVRRRFRIVSGNKCYTSDSVASGDLAQGPPPEFATGLPTSKHSTEPTTSEAFARRTNTSKSRFSTIESSAFPQPSSQTSLEITDPILLLDVADSEPDSLLADWTSASPSGPLTEHMKFARTIDWSVTSIGAMSSWSPEFRQIANLTMACPHPIALFWGDELTMMYNEAYRDQVAGVKHPSLMGTGFRGPFSEIWEDVGPIFAQCWRTGKAANIFDQMLPMIRYGQGFLEETYFSWCFVPLYGGGDRILGFYNAPFETTGKMLAERRTKTLRTLGESTAMAKTVKEFWTSILKGLEDNEFDVPFALLYSVTTDGSDEDEFSNTSSGSSLGSKSCVLEGCLGVPRGHMAAPEHIDLKRSREGFVPSFREAMRTREPTILQVRDGSLPVTLLDGVSWRGYASDEEPCREATIFPLRPTNGENVLGFLLIGTNPRLPYNDGYESFVNLLNRQLATSLASTILFEEEIKKSMSAAQIAALENVQLSEQLATQKRRFQKMSELSTVGLFILSPNGLILEANDTWYRLTGNHRVGDLETAWIESVADDSRPEMSRGWHILTVDQKPWSGELKMKKPWLDDQQNPQISWVLAAAHPEFDTDGTFVGVMFSMTEISHLKWAQSLQSRRLEEAEEQRRQQNNFIDITSHEMRNPLSAILQCADGVSTAMASLLNSPEGEVTNALIRDCKEAAETIAFCAQHQKSIVDDILTISKLDSALLKMSPATVQPLALVLRACKMFETDASKKGINLSFAEHETFSSLTLNYVTMDANRVMQILINLLTNAIKFTQSEPTKTIVVRISAFLTPPEKGIPGFTYVPIKSTLEELNRATDAPGWGSGDPVFIGFVVEDTGRGLTADEKKGLFVRFSQASPRTHAMYGGSGLGLFISRQLTELHGGRIGVASERGVGSSFGFYIRTRRADSANGEDLENTLEPSLREHRDVAVELPRPKEVTGRLSPHQNSQSGLQGTLRIPSENIDIQRGIKAENIWILVVEDNMVNQKVLRKQLEKLKHNVSVANHGREALEHLERTNRWAGNSAGQPLSIILMDLEMPIMNGEKAAEQIRELEAKGQLLGHVPIIAVSANVRLEQVNAAKSSGMDDFVSKPFRVPELVARINKALAQ